MKLHPFATVAELRSALAAGTISSQDVIEFYLKRFQAFDGQIGSAIEVYDKDSILKETNLKGPLHGIPGLIKNNICMRERVTTCGSKMLEHFKAPYDATAIKRLKQEGASLIGSANLDEFAMGSSTEASAFKRTANPWDTSRVPGGSSGGAAAAVAAGLVPWALGSETGGSVRQPAALCGVVGLKPTYGLVSRYGLVAYASSLDQIGIVTHTVYDNALILSVIAGNDEHDSSSLPVEKKDYTKNLTDKLTIKPTIGIVENALHAEGMDPEIVASINDAIAVFEKLGVTVKRIKLPALEYGAATYFIVSRAEAASNLSRFDGVKYGFRDKKASTLKEMYFKTRHNGFGKEVRRRIMVGNYVLSAGHARAFYENAKVVQNIIRDEFAQAFKGVDLLLMPVHPMPAFKFGAFDVDKLQMDLQDYFTCPMNLAGIPALSIPCGFTKSKLPIGFQLAGPHLSEELIFQVAHAYQQATPWHTMHPSL